MMGWMAFCPFFWACVIGGDGALIVASCQSALRQWGTSKFGAYLARPERNLAVFFMCNGVCWHSRSGQCPLLSRLWDGRTKGKKVSVCGRRCGLGQASIFNLCAMDTKHSWTLTVDHTDLSASSAAPHKGVNTFHDTCLLAGVSTAFDFSQRLARNSWN